MVVTLPVFQLEISWLNAEAPKNTVTMNGVGKELVSIQTVHFCWRRFVSIEIKRKKEEGKHEKNKDGYKNVNNNITKREWVKREMLRTGIHVRDTPRVPIGDVLIKCCSVTEHCDNERGWERVCIHSNNSLLLRKICFNWNKKKKRRMRKL